MCDYTRSFWNIRDPTFRKRSISTVAPACGNQRPLVQVSRASRRLNQSTVGNPRDVTARSVGTPTTRGTKWLQHLAQYKDIFLDVASTLYAQSLLETVRGLYPSSTITGWQSEDTRRSLELRIAVFSL